MVKKLFKHEIKAYSRVMIFVYIILLSVATFGRIIQFFESDSVVYGIISVFSFITYGVSILVAIGFTVVLGIVRFYKNLFTGEGYLSFTLPVTPTQHIAVKALTGVMFDVITWILIAVSACIITAGELLVEIFKAAGYIIEKLFEIAGFHMVIYILEVIAILLAASVSSFLLYYTFISIGQLFKKNRILAAFGAYFVYYIINQILGTILTVVVSLFADSLPWMQIGEFVTMHPYASFHIVFCTVLVLSIAFAILYFVIIRLIIHKRLNLE